MSDLIELRPGRRIQLATYLSGSAQPTLFMIHGLGGRGDQWREQIKSLQNRFNLIVPDLLGHGGSEKPESTTRNLYSFDEMMLDIQILFDRYATDKNIIFGHSYGGAFASYLAQENQKRIQRLVLIAPLSCQPVKSVPLAYLFPNPVLEWLRPHLDRSFEKMAFASMDDPHLLKVEKENRDLNKMYVIKSLILGLKHIPFLNARGLQQPSLIICGRQDKVIPLAAIENFYGDLPQHQFKILEDAAHMIHLEKSEAVNRLIDPFLA